MTRLNSLGLLVAAGIAVAAPIYQAWKTRQETTKGNLKMVGLATLMYCSDFDDVMPRSAETKSVFAAMYPYAKNGKIFHSANPGSRLQMNPAIGGVAVTQIESPATTIMFYDEQAWPDRSHVVVYCDGHAAVVSAANWPKVEKSLRLKLKRIAKPLPNGYWKRFKIKDLGD